LALIDGVRLRVWLGAHCASPNSRSRCSLARAAWVAAFAASPVPRAARGGREWRFRSRIRSAGFFGVAPGAGCPLSCSALAPAAATVEGALVLDCVTVGTAWTCCACAGTGTAALGLPRCSQPHACRALQMRPGRFPRIRTCSARPARCRLAALLGASSPAGDGPARSAEPAPGKGPTTVERRAVEYARCRPRDTSRWLREVARSEAPGDHEWASCRRAL
jgi:hypothetical protein